MRRNFDVDVLTCDACGGRRRLLTAITDKKIAREILDHLSLAPHPPPLARARDPTDDVDETPPIDDV